MSQQNVEIVRAFLEAAGQDPEEAAQSSSLSTWSSARSATLMDQRLVEACSSDSRSNSRTSGPVGESVAMAKFRVGFGGPPDAARSPVVDYPGMPSAELVTAHVELLLEEAGVRGMSQENVELATRWYEPWATTSKAELLAELPRAMELCHPEVEWSQREEGRTLRGREGVREALEGWLDSFDEYRFEVWRIFDCGFDEVLVVGLEVGRGASSGAEVRSHAYELLTFRDGKIVRFRDFHDERDAFEAAGCGSSEATAHQASRCPGRPHGPIALFG